MTTRPLALAVLVLAVAGCGERTLKDAATEKVLDKLVERMAYINATGGMAGYQQLAQAEMMMGAAEGMKKGGGAGTGLEGAGIGMGFAMANQMAGMMGGGGGGRPQGESRDQIMNTLKQLGELKDTQERFRSASVSGDAQAMVLENNRFHEIIGEMSANAYLQPSLGRLLIDHARIGHTFFRPRNDDMRQRLQLAVEHHDGFIAAIAAHEAKAHVDTPWVEGAAKAA